MPGNLFSEFAPSDRKAWEKQAEKEIKGPVSELKLLKITGQDDIEPYLTPEDLDNERIKDLQKCQKKNPGWLNMPLIKRTESKLTNLKINNTLQGGAQAILLDITNTDLAKCEFPKLLHSIRLSDVPVYFKTEQNSDNLFDLISKGAGYYIKGGIAHDPIAHWMRSGQPFDMSFDEISVLLKKTKNMREFYPLMIESHVYHQAGANPVQELAFLISAMVGSVDILTNAGISPLQAINHFFFSVSAGTEYLTETSKLRALRYLYRKISRAYKLPDDLCHAFIHVSTSSFFNTEQLPHNNMLRATSEAMSAVVGGCNALTVRAYNHTYAEPDEFSDRIARNVSLLIANESYLNHVADPSAGSYFIENLTLKMADAAWSLFLTLEQKGGIITAFKNGFVQDEIEKSWNEKILSMSQERVIIGVNKFGSKSALTESDDLSIVEKKDETNQFRLLPERNLAKQWMNEQKFEY